MDTIRFTIPLAPRGQKRTDRRAFILKGRGKGGKDIARVHSFKGGDQRLEEDKLLALIFDHRPPEPIEGPICLTVRAYLPIPASKSKKWKAAALAGEVRPTTKPDCSNMVKHLEDIMQGVFFRDDKEIVNLIVEKWYGEPARWEINLKMCDTKNEK